MRYAILFCGMPHRRHLNGLEFCYRALLDRFGFEREHVHVLIHDGLQRTCEAAPDGAPSGVWPGDGTPFRMRVTDEGNRSGFLRALEALGDVLTEDDLLFINTTGHGGNYNDGRGPYLTTYPYGERYMVRDFCTDVATLPVHHSLLVVMTQCFSGGFNKPVVGASRAKMTFIASAARETECSNAASGDVEWDSFQRNWITAIVGQGNRPVGALEAFNQASLPHIRHPDDSPEFWASCAAAGQMTLERSGIRATDRGLPSLEAGGA
jgi:hypothetical protein